MQIPQHLESNYINPFNNQRVMTDEYLAETSPYYSEARNNEEIELKKQLQDYVQVFDSEIAELRNACRNTLNRGDALEIILKRNMREFPGLLDGAKIGVKDVEEVLTEDSEGSIMDTVKRRKVIETGLYKESEGCTYYFIKG